MTPNEIDIGKILLIFKARAGLIIGILAVFVSAAGVLTYFTPKMYSATATLNFEFSTNPVDTRGRLLSEDTYLTTQIGIIESQNVAQEVENRLSEYERERLIDAFDASHSPIKEAIYDFKSSIKSLFAASESGELEDDGDYGGGESLNISSAYSWLANSIGSYLSVEPMLGSRIVEISYESADPKIAALMANKYTEAYIYTSVKMITDPARKSKVWFDEQLKSLRKRLEETQDTLTAYQQQEGIVSSDKRLDLESARLQDLASQLVTTQQATRNATTEQRKLKEIQGGGASIMTFRPVFDSSIVQNIKGEMRSIRGNLAQKSSSLGRNHPEIKKLNSELYSAQTRLDAEVEAIIDGIDNAAELSRERELDLKNTLEAQKLAVLNLKNEHDKISVLQREVESAQTTYNAALSQMNTTSMQSMVDQTNVSLVDGANIPSRHSSPRVMLNMGIGAFGGLLLGISIALFLELIVRRVHSGGELIAELEIPLLGHLSK